MKGHIEENIFLKPVDESELITIINKLKTNSRPVWDGIGYNILKLAHM